MKSTLNNYKSRTKCLVDQFDSYYDDEAKLNVFYYFFLVYKKI